MKYILMVAVVLAIGGVQAARWSALQAPYMVHTAQASACVPSPVMWCK
jgi:hypothetical protein